MKTIIKEARIEPQLVYQCDDCLFSSTYLTDVERHELQKHKCEHKDLSYEWYLGDYSLSVDESCKNCGFRVRHLRIEQTDLDKNSEQILTVLGLIETKTIEDSLIMK